MSGIEDLRRALRECSERQASTSGRDAAGGAPAVSCTALVRHLSAPTRAGAGELLDACGAVGAARGRLMALVDARVRRMSLPVAAPVAVAAPRRPGEGGRMPAVPSPPRASTSGSDDESDDEDPGGARGAASQSKPAGRGRRAKRAPPAPPSPSALVGASGPRARVAPGPAYTVVDAYLAVMSIGRPAADLLALAPDPDPLHALLCCPAAHLPPPARVPPRRVPSAGPGTLSIAPGPEQRPPGRAPPRRTPASYAPWSALAVELPRPSLRDVRWAFPEMCPGVAQVGLDDERSVEFAREWHGRAAAAWAAQDPDAARAVLARGCNQSLRPALWALALGARVACPPEARPAAGSPPANPDAALDASPGEAALEELCARVLREPRALDALARDDVLYIADSPDFFLFEEPVRAVLLALLRRAGGRAGVSRAGVTRAGRTRLSGRRGRAGRDPTPRAPPPPPPHVRAGTGACGRSG